MIFCFDDFELDGDRLELRRAGLPVQVDPVALKLLVVLVRDAGHLVTKSELIARVWSDRAVSDNVITVAMVRLRKALGHRAGAQEFVNNLHGRGYRFVRPVTVRAQALAPIQSAAATSVHDEGSFVGRESVMCKLRGAVQDAQRGRGSACLLMGEAGIGKTRTVEELAREAASAGMRVAWGYCQEIGDTVPLWPVALLARDLLGLRMRSPELPALAPELRWLFGETMADEKHGMARPLAQLPIFEALLEVFVQASEKQPCLLVIDDLHRADAATLGFLRFWLDRITRTAILLVGTTRRGEGRAEAAPSDLTQVTSHRNVNRIVLERLELRSVSTFVARLFPDEGGRLARAVWEKSEGNPFFMVELARQLLDVERPMPESLIVPEEALALVRPRLLALDAAARGVLSWAAVIGRSFELSMLEALTGERRGTLMESLDDAIAHEVVIAAPGSQTAFAFGHTLMCDILYRELPPRVRRHHHRCIAELLERQRAGGEMIASALLAYHSHAALPEGDIARTVAHCADAANEASYVFAYADCIRFLRHAQEALLLSPSPPPAVRMELMRYQMVFARISASCEFEPLARALARLAREHGSGLYLAHAGLLLHPHPGFPAHPEARAALEDALPLLADGDENRALALGRLATLGPSAFDARSSEAELARALTLLRDTGATVSLSRLLLCELFLRGGPGLDATATLAELEQLCCAHPYQLSVPPILLALHRAIRAFQAAELAKMSEALTQAETRCRELDSRELLWHVQRCQVLSRLSLGRREVDERALRALHRRARDESIVGTGLLTAHDEIVVLGDAASAHPSAHRALSPSADDPPNLWSLKIRALVAAERRDEARAALRRLPSEQLASLPRDRDYLGTLGALARAAVALEELGHAEVLYGLLQPYSEQLAVHVSFWCEGFVAGLLSALARALGRSEADAHARAATVLEARVGRRFEGSAPPRRGGGSATPRPSSGVRPRPQ